MKRSAFRPKRPPKPAKQMDGYTTRPREVAEVIHSEARMTVAVPKEVRFESEAWRRAVASLPCVFCKAPETQAAHRNELKSMGRKTDDALTAALCPPCHAYIDSGKDLTREQRRSEMDRAIVLTVRELARRGWLRVSTAENSCFATCVSGKDGA